MPDIIERAEAELKAADPFYIYHHLARLVPELVAELKAARAENKQLRSYKFLPEGMVWQDYYSPDDVIEIRDPLDAEIERLQAEQS